MLALAGLGVAAGLATVLLTPVHLDDFLRVLTSALPIDHGEQMRVWWTLEDLGNAALFMPVGLVTAAWLRSPTRGVLLAVIISAACEAAQLAIPSRHASLGDLLFNALGAVAGAMLARRLLGGRADARPR